MADAGGGVRKKAASGAARRWVAAVVLAGVAVALIATWLSLGESPAPPQRSINLGDPLVGNLAPDDPYIGSRSCAPCHPGPYASFRRSGHSQTLKAVESSELADRLDGRSVRDPERPNLTWTYTRKGTSLFARREANGLASERALELVLGSLHHAATFVFLTSRYPISPAGVEHRISYFRRGDELDITPGQHANEPQTGRQPSEWGAQMGAQEILQCLGCHATRLSGAGAKMLDLDRLIPNVSCERCHGPGRAHVEAANAGLDGPALAFGLESWKAEEMMEFCGECHRHPSRFSPADIRPDNEQIARFQPVGLMQSRCYKESDGALSCVNCHNPHARTTSDPAQYVDACLQCHSANSPKQVPCPVSPDSDCVQCHMPKSQAGQKIDFTDHWIRVREKAGAAEAVKSR